MTGAARHIDGNVHRALILSGPLLFVGLLIGMGLLGPFLPPTDPQASAQVIAHQFALDKTKIRIGCFIMIICITFFATWGAAITMWVRRMESRFSVLTYTSLILLGCGTAIFVAVPMTWAVAAFRPEMVAPDITLTLNDFAWFLFLFTWPPFSLWAICISVAVFRSTSARPELPRWVAYYSIWLAILISPAGLMAFWKDGPFAYDGLFAFWVPVAVYASWMCVMCFSVLKAIKTQEQLDALSGDDGAVSPPVSAESVTPTVSGAEV